MSCGGGGGGEDERPLKKARFAWQVKGRARGRARDEAPPDRGAEGEGRAGRAGPSSERSVEFLGDYLLKQNLNYWESLVERTLAERREVVGAPGGGRRAPGVPVSLVNRAHDQELERWQSVQITRGVIDNTINRVLDSWTFAPLPASTDDQTIDAGNPWSRVLGVAEFINNLPGHNVENEGILMAISAHGLQNTPNSQIINENYDDNRNVPSRTGAESAAIEDDENSNINNTESTHNLNECDAQAWSDLNRPCICSHTLRNSLSNAEVRPLVPFHRRDPTTPYAYLQQPVADNSAPVKSTPPRESESPESESSHEDNKVSASSNDNIFDEHLDFMDTAVSFAIQNKGLASYGTEYG